jgi:RimJ/RimL family protein N-acetyltransferase
MGLATACAAAMLRDCMARGITVHWDAQNAASRRLAEKLGFVTDWEYPVYWVDTQEGLTIYSGYSAQEMERKAFSSS